VYQLGRHSTRVRIGRVQLLAPLRVKPLACRGPDATTPMCSKCSSRFGASWIILVANALARCCWKTNFNGERVMRWASSCSRLAPHLANTVRGTSIPPTAQLSFTYIPKFSCACPAPGTTLASKLNRIPKADTGSSLPILILFPGMVATTPKGNALATACSVMPAA